MPIPALNMILANRVPFQLTIVFLLGHPWSVKLVVVVAIVVEVVVVVINGQESISGPASLTYTSSSCYSKNNSYIINQSCFIGKERCCCINRRIRSS